MSIRDAAIVALANAEKFESGGRYFFLVTVWKPVSRSRREQPIREQARASGCADDFVGAGLPAKTGFPCRHYLRADEKDHLRRVREIYEQLKGKPDWPEVGVLVADHSAEVDGFAAASANLAGSVAAAADADAEAALHAAMGMEQKGLTFHREHLGMVSCDSEAEFYRTLVAEEELHAKTQRSVLAELVG